MENLSHSRHPNRSKKISGNAAAGTRSLYDDVYGGPPKFSAAAKTTLSPRMEDYSEIFGSFQASRASSIPVLDLPAVDESEVLFDVRSSGFDYAEVFGAGYEGLDYAVSYEDLVNGDSSSEAWSPAEFESMSEESDASGKDQTFSNCGHRYQLDGSTEFSISYHQARQMSREDVSKGMTHVAQVHAVPGYSFMVDSPSQLKEGEMTANGYLDMDFSAEMMKAKHVKATTTSSNGSTVGRGFGNDLRQPKGQDNDGPSSRNSFLDISKISLRTQPFDLPPPARPPPMVGAKKGDSSKQRKTSAFEGIPGDSSPTFFDVEVDASSSAAVSAAAMKEAMEKAQAKLKSAKELMDKKKGLQGSYKLGSKKHMKDKAGETAMFIDGSKMKDEKEKGTSEKDGGGAEFVSREEKKRASKTEVPGNFRREELRSPHKNHVEDKHKKESRSLSGSSKIDETNECKEATEFFELVTTVEPQKDFEQANCEKISVHNVHIKQHKPKAKRGMETSEKQSGNGMNVNTDIEDHELEEFGERKKAQELSRPMEHNVKSKEASEMKVRGKNLQPSHVVCEGVENKMDSATAKQHSESNKRITEADKSVDEEETSTHHTPITCYNEGSSETLETVEETRAHENAEILNNEVLLGAVESKNEFLDKSFEASGTTNDGVMSDAREPLSSDHSVKKTSGEIKRKPNATDDSGVFEIEDLLSENLKDFGKLQEFLDASELSHLDNQVKDSIEVGSVIREPCEQIQSFSPKGSDSIRQAREFAHECKESGEDLTQAQVSLNQEKQGRESANRWVETGEDVTVSLSQEEKEGSMPTQVEKESKEAQPTMGEQKQMNQKPVQQVDASQTTEVKEEAYVEVDTEKEVRTPELEDQRLRKGEEEQERESEMEREVKPRDQKSVQQVNASQTTEIEEKKYEEIDIEKEKRERELENIRLRKVDEERERGREREGKPNNHKSVQQVKASKIIEIKEVYEEVDTEREKSERELENQRLQKVEEERISERDMEREKEVKPNNHKSVQQVKVSNIIEIKEFYEEVDTEREKSERELENQRLQKVEEERISERDMEREKEVKLKNQKSAQQVNASKTNETKEKTSEELGNEREKRERELLNQRLGKVEEEHERERDNEREREGKPKYQKSTEQVKASQTTERKDKVSVEVETERMERERELDNERRRHIEEERKREDKQKNQKLAQQVNASKTTERKEKTPGEVETERIRREREMEIERLKRIEEDREREREREKDRMAVDLATLEARERALVESRERAERAAVERVTAEARQRAMTEARERLEKACAEAREKSLAGKTTTEARIRAERAAVERATAEARERAAERAVAERAAALEAKDRVQRSVSDKFSASSRNNGMRQSSSSSDLQDLHYQNSGVSEYQYSSVYGERYDGGEGESAQRCKAIFERHRRTAERGAKALAEKNMRDLLAQREQAERNRLAETLDADVRRWSSGKEGNLRALLSTLQYILGPDGGWQPIPLTEVITSAAVKKAYRKATLCVHPDKLQQRGASIQHKYICEKVFDLLKEAWNKFNSEER